MSEGVVMVWADWLNTGADLAVAAGTGALAWATFNMAAYTRRTVSEAKEGLEQADRHHQENLRPFCVVEFKEPNMQYPFGRAFAPRPALTTNVGTSFPAKPYISIKGRLLNKGLGPAKDVVVYLNWGSSVDENGGSIEGRAFWLTHPVVMCGVIGAGEALDVNISMTESNIASAVVGGRRVPIQVLEWVARDAYEVVLRYRDIFNTPFRTIHARGFPQNLPVEIAVAGENKILESQQSTRQNRPTPVFLKGEQPWLTLTDVPQPPLEWLGQGDPDFTGEPFALD